MYVMLLLTFRVNTFRAGSVNSESAEPVDNQLHDTSYPGSLMLGPVNPGSSQRAKPCCVVNNYVNAAHFLQIQH